MKEIKIYTAGKMAGLTYEEQMQWRLQVESEIRAARDSSVSLTFVHPPVYYNYTDEQHKSQREILEWEYSQIEDSDIFIVNLEGIEDSIGTHMELGFINALVRNGRRIKVIGIGKNEGLYPWISESIFRLEETTESAAEYIANYLLV